MTNEEALETLLDNSENGCVDIEEVKLVFAELQNNSDEDCISRKAVLDEFYEHFADDDLASIDDYENYTKIVKALPSIQPTAKENLVVEDCISRAELLKAVDTWDRFGCDAGSSKLVPIKDCYVPYIHYDDVVKAIKGMPSVQPKPKTGHWIVYEDCEGKTRRCVCDRCGHETGDYTWKNPNFCEECGAKMFEPRESEGKE